MKVHNDAGRFYALISEGLHRRMMFQKLSQIYGPLIEELKVNNEFLIMMINTKLIDTDHLQEISGEDGDVQAMKMAHYIIHNINHYPRLKNILFIVQDWARDRNLIEDLKDIVFEIEIVKCKKINERIQEDSEKTVCEIY